jgi:hypothetical protein
MGCLLAVLPAGVHSLLRWPASWRAIVDEVWLAHERLAFRERVTTYGAPCVQQELAVQGLPERSERAARPLRADRLDTDLVRSAMRKRRQSTLGCRRPLGNETQGQRAAQDLPRTCPSTRGKISLRVPPSTDSADPSRQRAA